VAGPEDVSAEIVARLRAVCQGLPEAYEEPAWTGVRWRVRKRTFAHVLEIEAGAPQAYARAADHHGPVTVLTFRLPGAELAAVTSGGHPFYHARWGRDVVVLVLEADIDWDEVAELVTESYCLLAPKKLAGLVARPAE
jgi:predicted DNA-binding protein (MmcQ/YjbR family)